jgi:hypothetical protein
MGWQSSKNILSICSEAILLSLFLRRLVMVDSETGGSTAERSDRKAVEASLSAVKETKRRVGQAGRGKLSMDRTCGVALLDHPHNNQDGTMLGLSLLCYFDHVPQHQNLRVISEGNLFDLLWHVFDGVITLLLFQPLSGTEVRIKGLKECTSFNSSET